MLADLMDSLVRARREHAAAVKRGDADAARLLAEAVDVLERAVAGDLIPGDTDGVERATARSSGC